VCGCGPMQCRMQVGAPAGQRPYTGLVDVARRIVHTEGPRGLFRGLGATLMREVPGNTLFFGVYEVRSTLTATSSDVSYAARSALICCDSTQPVTGL
jgi:solute carrier family 25 carnitine/acylcarnitine transporter 20/29